MSRSAKCGACVESKETHSKRLKNGILINGGKNGKPFLKSTKKGIWKKEIDSIGPDFHHFFEQRFSAPLNLNQDKTRSLFPYFSGNSKTQIRQIVAQQT